MRKNLRWIILALLLGSTVLNYIDRQALSILASTIQKDLGIDEIGYAHIVQLFLLSYTAAYLLSGRLTDWLGTRIGLALFVGWWSFANMLTGLVRTATQLGTTQFLLGLGEAGNYTAAPKIVAERFPPEKRGFAIGVYTAGAMIGATVAPPLIGWLALRYDWQTAFFVTGGLGAVWVCLWLLIVPRSPKAASGEKLPVDWKRLLRTPALWWLLVARMLTDPVWYFYLFWYPKYLMTEQHLTLFDLARLGWIVYLAADLGSILGGLASAPTIKWLKSPVKGRLVIMAAAALVIPMGGLISTGPSLAVVLTLAALVSFCHQMWLVNLSAMVTDIFPARSVGTAFGTIGAGSGFGGMLSAYLVGVLVTWQSYGLVFLCMAVLHPIALLIVLRCRNTPVAAQG